MANQKQLEKAARLVKNHTGVTEIHFTSDNQAFFDKKLAEAHAQTLKKSDITTISASEAEAYGEKNPDTKPPVKGTKADKANAAGNANGNEPKVYTEMSVAELKNLCKERGIEFKNNAKQADLVQLLTEADAKKSEETV